MARQAPGKRITLLSAAAADNEAPAEGTASGETLTLTGLPVADETVTIGATVYTWKATADLGTNDAEAYQVAIGATASDSIDNLIAAINGSFVGRGVLYSQRTVAHPTFVATAGAGDTMDIASKHPAQGGTDNGSATTETMTNGSWGGATTSGGVNRAGVSLTPIADPMAVEEVDLVVVLTGTGAVSADLYLWGMDSDVGHYGRLGSGATAGHVNEGTALSGSDKVVLKRAVAGLGSQSHVYLEIDNLTGTDAAVTAYITERLEANSGD